LGGFALGWVEAICLVSISITLGNQREIGTGVGIASSLRATISTVASTIFTTILSNRLAQTVPENVNPALLVAGLPASSLPKFMSFLASNQSHLTQVPGVNATIIGAGIEAYKEAHAQAYSTVYLSTLAFSGLGVIFSLMTPEIESRLNNDISCKLDVGEAS
jgi:hypothetical protein